MRFLIFSALLLSGAFALGADREWHWLKATNTIKGWSVSQGNAEVVITGGQFRVTLFSDSDKTVQRQSRLATAPKDDWDVLTAVSLIQSVLDAHSDSREVGGPIDSLTVTPVGIRWYSQKKECQNQH